MSEDDGAERDLPPIEWPEGREPPSGQGVRSDGETPPVWADALRLQLLGVLVLLAGGLVAASTTGLVGVIAELVAIAGVAVGLVGFYSWPVSSSNNS